MYRPPLAHLTPILILLATCCTAQAQQPPPNDPRLGVCTHFAQGWDAQKTMPLIEKSGIGWIRDDLGWESIEKTKGQYHIPDRTLAWIRSAHAHHLRVLLILNGSNRLYPDRYDPQAFARWAAWIATELKNDIDALEILVESRSGAAAPSCSVSTSRSSNRTCGFPASGSPKGVHFKAHE